MQIRTHLFNLFWMATTDIFPEEDMYILRRQKCVVLSTVCDAELCRELQAVLDSFRAEPLFDLVIGFPLALHFSGEVRKKFHLSVFVHDFPLCLSCFHHTNFILEV